jgi:deoxyribodipyrimidine photolyase-related protein
VRPHVDEELDNARAGVVGVLHGFALASGLEDAEQLLPAMNRPSPAKGWLPLVAVPTTLSGAEYTRSFSVNDRAAGQKRSHMGSGVSATAIVYDPMVTVATPEALWVGTGFVALDHAIEVVLPRFGPYEDAMTTTSWHLTHTLLSPALNLGLLHPREVADAIEVAYRSGAVPIASAEGLLRQVIGWREYVWCTYWSLGPDYLDANELGAVRSLPPLFSDAPTQMACLSHVLSDVDTYGWTHHIPRLMVLGNLGLLAGVDPRSMMDWMWERFVDGAEWVMAPNVIGMALYADGGAMATKPYAAGGAYIDKMSDFCGDCVFDRRRRTGEQACPFTSLYWDFIARHADRFSSNPRMARQVAAARRLSDLDEVRERAVVVLERLDRGEL